MAAARALAIFKEDMNGSIDAAKSAAQRLGVIAVVMGKQATKAELLPFVLEKINDPETADEVLFRLAEQLDMGKLVGGFDAQLVAALEVLCASEETLVRDAATKSVSSLVSAGSFGEAKEHWQPMFVRLCAEANWYTARVSAAAILPAIYGKLDGGADASSADAALLEMRELLLKLGNDETPMVKRGVAICLGALAAKVSRKGLIASEMKGAYRALLLGNGTAFEPDAIRVLAIASLPAYAAFSADSAEGAANIHELCESLVKDASWKVRVAIATHLGAIAKATAAGPSGAALNFVGLFDALQQDVEPEVRFVAANQAVAMADACNHADVSQYIVPNLLGLVTDQGYRSPQDRAVLAAALVDLTGHTDPHSDAALRIVAEVGAILSNAEESQFVRIQLIESSPKLIAAIGHTSAAAKELLAKLLKFFDPLSADAASKAAANAAADGIAAGSNPRWCWRLRYVAVNVTGSDEFVGLGVDFYREHLAPLVKSALADPCMLVRVAAVTCLAKWAGKYADATSVYGQWADENLVPPVLALRTTPEKGMTKSYAHRLTAIYALEASAGFLSPDGLAQLASACEKDISAEVPNVRVALARCFGRLSQSLDFKGSAAQQIVSSALQKLSGDADIDVNLLASASQRGERLPLTFEVWGTTGAPWVASRVGNPPAA